MEKIRRLGGSLLPAISVLPVASLMLGIGQWVNSFQSDSFLANLLIVTGNFILGNISILFALSVSMGLAKGGDVCLPISATLAFLMITNLLKGTFLTKMGITNFADRIDALEKLNNQFIGIIIGVLVAYLYNRFSETKLPKYLAFFDGPRIVPILTVLATLILGGILYFIWPYLFSLLVDFGKMISGLGSVGAGLFGFFNRLLVPTGLHNALNSVFWFDLAGINDIANFWSSKGEKGIVGMYQAGFFPVTMFGLPGAALAMYRHASNRSEKLKSLLIANAFTAFLMGVSEPIELLFMFSFPPLFLVHACLTGLSLFVCSFFRWTAGFGFSSGLMDYVLSLRIPIANQPYMLLIVGAAAFLLYYVLFSFFINKFQPELFTDEIGNSIE
ncbi:PTS transporter subunit EIIC [Candidatus Enterococcus murrayae]|uniref:PTS transporter subunit EIIC n=1 Tax=Candidatus Enterococcus murrayae TaxID=2815321 RepID=A0ABS3HNY5_9ENTE|nr:PTS transporter subunit EIIC [Enterococcus sp. MJM16]MBO0454278.1 PTS transporter subunit EIIC [Enterococcus sp. MJM16]